MAGKLKNCDGGQSATVVGGKPVWKCHGKDESSLIFTFTTYMQKFREINGLAPNYTLGCFHNKNL